MLKILDLFEVYPEELKYETICPSGCLGVKCVDERVWPHFGDDRSQEMRPCAVLVLVSLVKPLLDTFLELHIEIIKKRKF